MVQLLKFFLILFRSRKRIPASPVHRLSGEEGGDVETKLPLYWRGVEWGILRCWDQEVRTVFSVRCACPRAGLYKIYLSGGDGSLLLGTPMPEGSFLTLSRTLTHQALRQAGAFPPLRGELAPASSGEPVLIPSGWQTPPPGRLDQLDPLLREVFQSLPLFWSQDLPDGFSLAVPWRSGQAVPATPLICFAVMKNLEGRCCLLFEFGADGTPRIPA